MRTTPDQLSLFDAPEAPRYAAILTVSALNRYVADSLRSDPMLRTVRLRGQVSGFKASASGHWYFTLRDEESAIDCVLFRQHALKATFRPENGDEVILHGAAGLYAVTGRYQFYADSIRPEGVGLLWQRYEQLKARLEAEGLFSPARKRPLPAHARRIAVVTSEQGAVLHDICRVAGNRDPGLAIVLVPVPVQGAEAAPQLARGVEIAGRLPGVEAVIVARGGGSMEDLWCFNDEALARAIAACPVPVISAVGHETDFTIADFAADVRAATPSNAAELITRSRAEASQALRLMETHLQRAADVLIANHQRQLQLLTSRLAAQSPEAHLAQISGQLRQLTAQLHSSAANEVQRRLPAQAMAAIRLDSAMDALLHRQEALLRQDAAQLAALNPRRVLERGYTMATAAGRVITSGRDAPAHFTLHFADSAIPVRREDEEANHAKSSEQ